GPGSVQGAAGVQRAPWLGGSRLHRWVPVRHLPRLRRPTLLLQSNADHSVAFVPPRPERFGARTPPPRPWWADPLDLHRHLCGCLSGSSALALCRAASTTRGLSSRTGCLVWATAPGTGGSRPDLGRLLHGPRIRIHTDRGRPHSALRSLPRLPSLFPLGG